MLRARLQKERQTIEQLEAQLQQRKQEVQRKVSHRAVSPVTVEEYVDLGRRLRRGDRDEHVEKKASRTSHRDGRARRLNDKSSREEVLDYVDGHRKELEKLQSKSRSHSDVVSFSFLSYFREAADYFLPGASFEEACKRPRSEELHNRSTASSPR